MPSKNLGANKGLGLPLTLAVLLFMGLVADDRFAPPPAVIAKIVLISFAFAGAVVYNAGLRCRPVPLRLFSFLGRHDHDSITSPPGRFLPSAHRDPGGPEPPFDLHGRSSRR